MVQDGLYPHNSKNMSTINGIYEYVNYSRQIIEYGTPITGSNDEVKYPTEQGIYLVLASFLYNLWDAYFVGVLSNFDYQTGNASIRTVSSFNVSASIVSDKIKFSLTPSSVKYLQFGFWNQQKDI